MKKYLFALLLIIIPSFALGSPFLTCDPYDKASGVTHFIVEIDGVTTVHEAIEIDGKLTMKVDLAGLSNGNHIAYVKARNLWGDSEPTGPFGFMSGSPDTPTNPQITR